MMRNFTTENTEITDFVLDKQRILVAINLKKNLYWYFPF